MEKNDVLLQNPGKDMAEATLAKEIEVRKKPACANA